MTSARSEWSTAMAQRRNKKMKRTHADVDLRACLRLRNHKCIYAKRPTYTESGKLALSFFYKNSSDLHPPVRATGALTGSRRIAWVRINPLSGANQYGEQFYTVCALQKSFCCRSKRISHVRPHCFSLKFSIRFAARLMASSCMNKTPIYRASLNVRRCKKWMGYRACKTRAKINYLVRTQKAFCTWAVCFLSGAVFEWI